MRNTFLNFINVIIVFLKKKDCSQDFHELEFNSKSVRQKNIEEY